jgi:hypothetical protein
MDCALASKTKPVATMALSAERFIQHWELVS